MNIVEIAMAANNGAASAQQQPSAMGMLLPFILIFVVLYVFMILPQKKQQKKAEEMKNSLKSGDKIIFAGGLFGTIKEIKSDKDKVQVEIGNGTVISILKNSIIQKVEKQDKKKDKK